MVKRNQPLSESKKSRSVTLRTRGTGFLDFIFEREGERLLFFDGLKHFHATHELSKRFRDDHGAVGLLELLKDSGVNAGSSKARAIKRVAELDFAFAIAIADHSAARLIIASVRHGRDLFIDMHGGDPNFDVIGPRHRMRAIACGELVDLIAEAEPFNKAFGFSHHLVKSGIAAFFGGVLDHLDLIELIAADHASLLSAIRAGFFAVAGGVGEIFAGEVIKRKNLVAMKVHQCGFGGWKEEFARFGAFKPENVLFEFGELASGVAGIVIQDVGWEDHLIAIGDVILHEIVEKCPF